MNKLILIITLYLLYKIGFIGKIVNTMLPFILAFVLAYAFDPLLNKLNKKLPKYISIIIIVSILLFILITLLYLIIPSLIKESNNIINIFIYFIKELSNRYNIDLNFILTKVDNILSYKHIITGINISISLITSFILCLISFIYFLIDIDNIKLYLKGINNNKLLNYLYYVNKDLKNYLNSLIKISVISFFEYWLGFSIIGHGNSLMMGMVAMITNLIPYIGSMLVLLIGILSCPNIIIKICILYIVLNMIDGYIINPFVYNKYNKINPLLVLISLSIGSIFGIKGMILSLPILIILLSTYHYFKDDINNKINYLLSNKAS